MRRDTEERNRAIWEMVRNGATRLQISNATGLPISTVIGLRQRMLKAGGPVFQKVFEDRREGVRRLRDQGLGARRIAATLGLSRYLVSNYLIGMAAEAIERENRRREDRNAAIVRARASGRLIQSIAKEMGVTVNVVVGVLHRARARGDMPTPARLPKRGGVTSDRLSSLLAEADKILAEDSAEPWRIKHSPRRSGRHLAPALELDVTET
jgi:hypothetical protein